MLLLIGLLTIKCSDLLRETGPSSVRRVLFPEPRSGCFTPAEIHTLESILVTLKSGAASMILTLRLALGIPAIFLQVCNGDTDLWTSYQYFGQQACGKEVFQQQCKMSTESWREYFLFIEDSRTNLDVCASPLWNVGVLYSVTNVHKLALTKRRWLYLLPGRLVCFLLKPV